jgi:hypothetical protein
VGRVASRAPLVLNRCVFVSERALLISVTFYAGRVGAGRQSGLFQLETSVRIMAIAALHGPLEHFVMKRFRKIRLRFAVAAHTKLRLARLQQFDG